MIQVYFDYDFIINPKISSVTITLKFYYNRFLFRISVCLRTDLADYFHDLFRIYLHETLALLLSHTYFSLLPSDIILGYNFCSLKETDQKIRRQGHIVVLILIFLLLRFFPVPYSMCSSNFCVANLVAMKTLQASRIPDTHGLCYSFSARQP